MADDTKQGPSWKLNDDLRSVTITFPTDPVVTFVMTTEVLDELLTNLGVFRSQMEPEIPRDFALGQRVAAVTGPAWATEPDMMAGDTLLHMRDPRFGWLHFLISRVDAKTIADIFLAQAATPPATPPSGKAS
jgi:hypothetical protein